MDENHLRVVATRLVELDKLEARRASILGLLAKSGDLKPALERAVRAATTTAGLCTS
jgi:transcriptional accessory protein Tex/SPT6